MTTQVDEALRRIRREMPVANYLVEAREELGEPGAMLSGSKTAPEEETVYWNACIFNEAEEQIWHGDLNLTRKADALQRLADRIGIVHVTPEQPFRFKGFRTDRAEKGERIVTFNPETPR